jgi:hypothetical protein
VVCRVSAGVKSGLHGADVTKTHQPASPRRSIITKNCHVCPCTMQVISARFMKSLEGMPPLDLCIFAKIRIHSFELAQPPLFELRQNTRVYFEFSESPHYIRVPINEPTLGVFRNFLRYRLYCCRTGISETRDSFWSNVSGEIQRLRKEPIVRPVQDCNFVPFRRDENFFEYLRNEQPVKYFGKGVHAKYGGSVDRHRMECCGPICIDEDNSAKRRLLQPDTCGPKCSDMRENVMKLRRSFD